MFRGSIPALATPFAEDGVDIDALQRLVDWQINEGSSGIVSVGTTGESPTLSHAEHERVVSATIEAAGGRAPVIAGAGSNSTLEAISLTQHARAAGAQAALVVAPYYNKPSQEGLYRHFKAVHDASDIPIILYNVPGRTVADISSETVLRLAELPRVVGIKDASADLTRPSVVRRALGDGFCQLSGEDGTALGFNAHGGVGCISVTANVAPRACAELQAASLRGDYAAARALQDRLIRLHRALFLEPSPAPTKYALSLLGRCANRLRSPIFPVSNSVAAEVSAAMAEAGVLDAASPPTG